MGRAKAFLPHADGSTTFLAHAIQTCHAAGIDQILVVGRSEDVPLRAEVGQLQARFVPNPHADRGQLSSVLAGMEVADREFSADAILVWPVDVPLVTAPLVRALVQRAHAGPEPIVRATSHGRHGHPVIFKREVFAELRATDPSVGARAVVRADASRVANVDVGDPAAMLDVDTPEDYHRAFGRPV